VLCRDGKAEVLGGVWIDEAHQLLNPLRQCADDNKLLSRRVVSIIAVVTAAGNTRRLKLRVLNALQQG
jgi:hypothetical protein